MIGSLLGSLVQMGGAYGALRLKRFKAKLVMGLLSLAVFAVFALLALIWLCVIVFIALANNYGPMTAAVSLFGISCLLCLLTVVVHLLAARAPAQAKNDELVNGLKAQLPSALSLGMALGRQTKTLFRPKNLALAALLAAGTAIASRPVSTFRLVKHLLHKDVEKVERRHFWDRFTR